MKTIFQNYGFQAKFQAFVLESDFISPTQPGPSKISFFCLVLAMKDANPLYKLHSFVTPPPKNCLRLYLGGLRPQPPPPQIPYINALFPISHFSRLVVF
jgi:hypothetical protein